ncbi:MAG: hypothetical protein JST92_26330 [Deltaproteobacteria bacterium]|nr:hypothetical protein [Deltaproteobacteria bacterium]
MIAFLLAPFRALLAWLRRRQGRRQARALLAAQLPRARQLVAGSLPERPPRPAIALRIPGVPEAADPLDFWALPLGSQAIRAPGRSPPRLLRVRILPPPLGELGRARLSAFRLDADARPTALRPLSVALDRPVTTRIARWTLALSQRSELLPAREAPAVLRPEAFGLSAAWLPGTARELIDRTLIERLSRPRGPQLDVPAPFDALGVASPSHFGLDELLRTEAQREPLPTMRDRPPPPAPGRTLKPRTPLPRAPVVHLKGRNFRLAPGTLEPANEEMQPPRRDWDVSWVAPMFKKQWHPEHWMSQDHLMFLAPTKLEWFCQWWEGFREKRTGGLPYIKRKLKPQIEWAQEHVKEQMLIRRDVKKDEENPRPQQWTITIYGPKITYHEAEARDLDALIPEMQYIAVANVRRWEVPPLREAAEAYIQWRTLMSGLEER